MMCAMNQPVAERWGWPSWYAMDADLGDYASPPAADDFDRDYEPSLPAVSCAPPDVDMGDDGPPDPDVCPEYATAGDDTGW